MFQPPCHPPRVLSETPGRDFRRSPLLLFIALLSTALIAESGSANTERVESTQPVSAPNERNAGQIEVWARAGAQLVVPFDPSQAQIREGLVTARMSGGAILYAPLWWVGPGPRNGPGENAPKDRQTIGAALVAFRAATWMNAEASWEALSASAAIRREAPLHEGRWYLVIDIPPEVEGQQLVLDGRRIATGWLRRVPFDTPRRDRGAITGWAEACLDSARRSPYDRWRARMAAGEPLVAPGPARDEFGDKTLESLAEQIESEWSEALDRLGAADAALAGEFRDRLGLLTEFGSARVPAWPVDDGSLERLLRDLLSPAVSAQARARRVREWLHALPRHAAWVADDAALVDFASGVTAARVAGLMLNPRSGPTAMMISRPGASRPEEIVSLNPAVVETTLIGADPGLGGDAGLIVGLGDWTARRSVVHRALPARPPGLSLSPFFHEWTMGTWLEACTDSGSTRTGPTPAGLGQPVSDDVRKTAAMLLAQDVAGSGESSATRRRWLLYVECRVPPASAGEWTDEVLIHLAGKGGEVTLRAFADGQVVTSRGESSLSAVEQADGGWSAWIPLPENVLADGHWIRLGITRTDPTGMRSSWPRPVFPWEDRPPHAAIELGAWDGFPGKSR